MNSCARCNRPLTNSASVVRGLGPICSAVMNAGNEEEKQMELFAHEITREKWESLCELRPILISGSFFDNTIRIDDRRVDIHQSRKIQNHSLEFSWRYGGSGPAQTALAILLAVTGIPSISVALHQEFKWEFVAHWAREGFSRVVDIGAWLKKKESCVSGFIIQEKVNAE